MTLHFTGYRDQAILALVVKEASESDGYGKHYLGRTAIQKILYFLKVRGVKLSYRFEIFHYGPYCEDVVTDIDRLIADRVVKDLSGKRERYSNYAPGRALDELMRLHPEITLAEKRTIKETTEALVPLEPKLLELISTLDYLLRDEMATGRKTDLKAAVVNRFMTVKRDRFEKPTVERMYDVVDQLRAYL